MASANLHELFVDEIRDIYHAEQQLTKALPKLARHASSETLRRAIEHHLEETRGQVSRLEQVFEMLDEKASGKPCAGMAGIIEEADDLLGEQEPGAVLDAAIVAGAQRAEHYEMAAYGAAIAWARAMGHNDVADLLEQTLGEEKAADATLTEIAEDGVNRAAMDGSAGDTAAPQGRRSTTRH
jgi:ferritin-like metal-binding protein YciE